MRRSLLTPSRLLLLSLAALLFALYAQAGNKPTGPATQAEQNGSQPPPLADSASAQSAAQFQLRVESNLVVVRVVVRDSQGRPLGNLKKENFSLFDNGEEQKISQFSVEAGSAGSPAPSAPGSAAESKQPVVAAPPRYRGRLRFTSTI